MDLIEMLATGGFHEVRTECSTCGLSFLSLESCEACGQSICTLCAAGESITLCLRCV